MRHRPHAHPETSSISEGYDPSLSVMAVRPPIYPVSTYCFATAQQAAHHFEVALGKVPALPGERESLIYARLNHPNAEMFEDALRSVEKGAEACAAFRRAGARSGSRPLPLDAAGRAAALDCPILAP